MSSEIIYPYVKNCEYCSKEFYCPRPSKDRKERRACSKHCSNKIKPPRSIESKLKSSQSAKKHRQNLTPEQKIEYTNKRKKELIAKNCQNCSKEYLVKSKEQIIRKFCSLSCSSCFSHKNNAFISRHNAILTDEQYKKAKIAPIKNSKHKVNTLRETIKIEQEYKCNRCKLELWQDVPITLELEHKDGNNKNNKRENLELLCPNCHALTPTWRGRNKNNSKGCTNRIEIEGYPSIRQYLIARGLTPKGKHYKLVQQRFQLKNNKEKNGEPDEIRTHDPQFKRMVLSTN